MSREADLTTETPGDPRPAARGMREREAAVYIGVAPKTLANWRSAGKGPRFYKLGRMIVYRREDLDRYFDEHLQAPAHG